MKVHHLLHHTSGLPDYINLFETHWEPHQPVSKKRVATNTHVLEMLKQHSPKPLFPPGEQYEYSNTGYVVLASIVAKVSGQSFGDFMKERVFHPLKMDRAYVYSEKGNSGKRAYGFLGESEKKKPNDLNYLAGIHGDGGIYASLADLRKWDRALHGRALLSTQSLSLAFKPLTLNNGETYPYGFGWDLIEDSNGPVMAHSGSWLGFRAYFRRVPHQQRVIAVLTNNTSSATRDLVYALLDIMDGKPYEAPKMSIVGPLAIKFMENGADAGVAAFWALKKDGGDRYNFSEGELNDLGYLMVKRKRLDLALAAFQLNVEMYPKKSNPHDSLGEAYMLNGMTEKALKSFKRSLALNPENHNAKAMINKLKAGE